MILIPAEHSHDNVTQLLERVLSRNRELPPPVRQDVLVLNGQVAGNPRGVLEAQRVRARRTFRIDITG